MTGQPKQTWFLRSMGDHDTHCGTYSTVTRSVHSRCGVEFVPKPLPYGRISLPGAPQDPEQVCPQCREGKPANRRAVR